MKKILFIENDQDYADIISEVLENQGYKVEVAETSKKGLDLISTNEYDLAIIDLHLDSLNGMQVVELIQNKNLSIYIMMLTGSISDEDEIRALQNGVDEYLRKSVSIAVMLERISRVFLLERGVRNEIQYSKVENIELNPFERTVTKNGENIKLTFLEFDLLNYFLKNRNKLLRREDIYTDVWGVDGNDAVADFRAVDTFVKNIRMKMNVSSIYSIRGVGYRWYEE